MHTRALLVVLASLAASSLASSRVTYNSTTTPSKPHFVTARSMDFPSSTNTTLWAFPPGTRRFGGVQDNPFTWTSRYGIVSAVVLGRVYVEGVNTRGLAGSAMYADDDDGGHHHFQDRDVTRASIFSGAWLLYFLDMYATVADVAGDYCPSEGGREPFQVVPELVLDGVTANVHLSLSDSTGDNLVVEFVEGELRCHQFDDYTVSTDGPSYQEQLSTNTHCKSKAQKPLSKPLNSTDRFASLSKYNTKMPAAPDSHAALAYAAAMIRTVSTPAPSRHPNGSSGSASWPTRWRICADLRTRRVLYESATNPATFWYDLDDLGLTEGTEPKVLTVENVPWSERMGDVTDKFATVTAHTCVWTDCEP